EELAATGVLAGVGHREGAGLVAVRVALGLALDRVAGPAGAGALGAAALAHEPGDHSVEGEAVVEPLAGQLLEVGHGPGRRLVVELELDDAAVLHLDGRVLHGGGL